MASQLDDPPTPPLNPVAHLLCQDSDDADDDTTAPQLFPHQQHSIIDETMVIRYYLDPKKEPHLLQDEDTLTSYASPSVIDIALLCDVTNGCGGKIWPAAEVLGAYLTGRREELAKRWKGKKVIELGSGTGLVGFVLAKLAVGAETWITDQAAMLELMKKNLTLNVGMDPCYVEELNWGQPLPDSVPPKPDVLLLADCVYLEVAFQPLVDTMLDLSTRETEILFCYQKRRKADKRFFTLLKKHFRFDDVEDDDPVRTEQYNRQGTRLYTVKLKG